MTREEAKRRLLNIERSLPNTFRTKEDVRNFEALEMAIKALEQEPSGDLISRQAVIDACEQSINILEAVDRIMDLPSVEQEPKAGHWKRISMDKYSEHAKYWYRCDRCGKDNLGNTDWCPNCGAKMIEQKESEGEE